MMREKEFKARKLINDRYQRLERIGRGKCANVFMACDLADHNLIALKMPLLGSDRRYSERLFSQEADALVKAEGPNVVRLVESGNTENGPFIAMEYVPGPTLRGLMAEGRLERGSALRLADKLCATLEGMHERGVVHRDLKPKNIMINGERDLRVIDFGFAHVSGRFDMTSMSRKAFGNPVYSPPERTNGYGDPRADIYSAGVIMYEMLAGTHLPILNMLKLYELRLAGACLRTEAGFGRIDRQAAGIITRATERSPHERFQSAKEMREAIEALSVNID